ncbi:sugar transferase [Selenomonas sp. TAMA-11512]|uniref:sugar transferase n=1 Tax=Selenomonas sp. TAMA-11512 TaxID=3095337 RepID=UPI00308D8336|nr:sugar transferase [Selenomonas sp. TAMA-11512]
MPIRQFWFLRKLLLFAADGVLILILGNYTIYHAFPSIGFREDSVLLPLVLITTWLVLRSHELYNVIERSFDEIFRSMIAAYVSIGCILFAFSFFSVEMDKIRLPMLWMLTCQFIALSLLRLLLWKVEKSLHEARKVLLIAPKEECRKIYHRLRSQPKNLLKLCYISMDVENDDWKSKVAEVDLLVLGANLRHHQKVAIMNYATRHGKQVRIIPNTYEVFCSHAALTQIDDIPVFQPQGFYLRRELRIIKRVMDIALSLAGLICTLPFMLFAVIGIKLDDGGPLFYSQIRVGRGGREFRIYKFRSMRIDAESKSGPMLAQEGDARITKMGNFLRMTRIDELPQIWNVFVGDMSIVGPRPERPFFVEQFTKEHEEYAYRHNVKPGITGFAQIYGKYNTTAFDKLVYDLLYIQQCSFLLDVVLILKTIRVLFTKSATEGVQTGKDFEDMKKYVIGAKSGDVYGDY